MACKRVLKQILVQRGVAMVGILFGCFCLHGVAHAGIPIQHWTQPGGAQVYLVNSPAIPMVDVQIDFDAGSRRDPARQAGLAQAMAQATSYGVRASTGTGSDHGLAPALGENALSDAWADVGASFGGGASADRLSFSLRSLTYPDLLQAAAVLASRQLGEPSYPKALWEREREKQIAALKEADTRPATWAGRAFAHAVYGPHPYGYEVTATSLRAISAADLRAWHDRMVRACHARVSVVGALDPSQADALVRTLLSRLPAAACNQLPSLPQVPEVAPLTAAQQIDIPFASAQSHVLIGQPGIKRNSSDYFALIVGNHILGGGGFTARLTTEVREKRGLTYSVYSYFAPGLHAGAFTIGLQTRPDQALQAVELVRTVLRDYLEYGPTEDELQAAKDNLVGGFALRLDSNRKLLDNVANIAWNDLPLDYLDRWTEQVQQLTTAQVHDAMVRALQPQQMVTVVVGAPSAP